MRTQDTHGECKTIPAWDRTLLMQDKSGAGLGMALFGLSPWPAAFRVRRCVPRSSESEGSVVASGIFRPAGCALDTGVGLLKIAAMKTFAFFLLPIAWGLSLSAQSFFQTDDFDVNDPPTGVIVDEWAEMYLDGGKIGYTRGTTSRDGDLILTVEETRLRIAREGAVIETSMLSETRERIDGTPVSIRTLTREGVLTQTRTIRFTPGGATIRTSSGGRVWDHEATFEPGFVLPWGFVRTLAAHGEPEPGDEITVRLYSPDITVNQPLPLVTRFGGIETISFRGESRRTNRIEQVLRIGFIPMEMTLWVDKEGRLLRGSIPLGGLEITLLGSTKEQALGAFEPPDLFTDSMVPLNRTIPPDAEQVTYLLRGADEGGTPFPTGLNQAVERRADGTLAVTVSRGKLDFPDTPGAPADERFLAPSLLVDFEDPAIRDLLDSADLNSLPPAEKVRRLVGTVDETIAVKSLDFGFATASQVVEHEEGDCTEHALLLAALGRAAGFPTRGASGLVYFEDEQGAPFMGYHMWTQVWNGSDWLDLDAGFGEAETSPIRILLSVSDLSNESFVEEALVISRSLGQTEVEVIDVRVR